MEQAPQKSYALLRTLLPKSLQPTLRGMRKRFSARREDLAEPFKTVYPFTQAAPIRQENILELCRRIEANGIAGDIVECGVLDGGMSALMAFGTRASGRAVHMFDSWAGLPEATEEDGVEGNAWVGEIVGSPRRVMAVMKKLAIEPSRLHFHRGWFHDTFPTAKIDKIALLHADGDFYESVRLTIETWFPKIVPGGYLQIDDYAAFVGCRKAVDEFLAGNPHLKLESVGTHTKAYFIQAV